MSFGLDTGRILDATDTARRRTSAASGVVKIGVVVDHTDLRRCVSSAIHQTPTLVAVHSHSTRHLPGDVELLVTDYPAERTSLPDHVRVLLEVSATGCVARIEATDTAPRATTTVVWDLGHRIHTLLHRQRNDNADAAPSQQFSDREREVLAGLAAGHTRRQIAQNLGISIHTVDTYKYRVKEKAQAETMADLVRTAISLEQTG